MARQSPGRRNAEEKPADLSAEVDAAEVEDDRPDDAPATDGGDRQSPDASVAAADADPADAAEPVDPAEPVDDDPDTGSETGAPDRPLWHEVRIDPVEIALPAGTGYTLRAYRMASTLQPTAVAPSDEDDPFAHRVRRPAAGDDETVDLDAEFDELTDTVPEVGRHRVELDANEVRGGGAADRDLPDDALADEEDEDEEAEEEAPEADEEVPVFLSHQGKVLLFRSAESLVAFVRSAAPNDLAQLDTWARLAERIDPADVAVGDDDVYELDLVVENLRGGHDAWDVELLIKAGEIARDLGYALRLAPMVTALSPGSPLDDLDEALRKTAAGGLGAYLGRRRLRKIGAQQATLGWRTIIGKISGAVDWRD